MIWTLKNLGDEQLPTAKNAGETPIPFPVDFKSGSKEKGPMTWNWP